MNLAYFFLLPSALLAWPVCHHLASSAPKNEDGLVFSSVSMSECLLSLAILGLVIASAVLIHRTARRIESHAWFSRKLASPVAMEWVWLFIQPFFLGLLRWPEIITTITPYPQSVSLCMALAILPNVLFFGLLRTSSFTSWGFLMTPVLGAIAVALLVDAGKLVSGDRSDPWVLPSVGETSMIRLLVVLILSGALMSVVLPIWIRWCSRSIELVDDNAKRIQTIWAKHTRTRLKVSLWPTHCRMSNALIVGFVHPNLLLTDRLLLRFTEREVDFIVFHELAHILRRHSMVRILPGMVAVVAMIASIHFLSGFVLGASCSLVACLFAASIVGTCWWTELDADRTAIRLAAESFELSTEEAGRQFSAVLEKLYRDNNQRRTSWSHPSIEQRIAPYRMS